MLDAVNHRTVMGLSFPTEAEHVTVALGRCRDHAMAADATAVLHASRADTADTTHAQPFCDAVAAYATAMARALTPEIEAAHAVHCREDFKAIRQFGIDLQQAQTTLDTLDRAGACRVLQGARDRAQPALVHLTRRVLEQAARDQNAVLDSIQNRNDSLERVMGRMEIVGRTINMISVNAAIEAARAGGDSGRAFGLIAKEVRALSDQAAQLLSVARHKIEERDVPR